jgi:hypothetical protein
LINAPTGALAEYGQQPLSRIAEASVIPTRQVSFEDWKPKVRRCHDDVAIWVKKYPSFKAIRGWLNIPLDKWYFTRFLAHSVVEVEHGDRFDITPLQASQPYAFIDCNLREGDYFDLERQFVSSPSGRLFDGAHVFMPIVRL